MPSRNKIYFCKCQKYCKAPADGPCRAVAASTYYGHKKTQDTEKLMSTEELEKQKSRVRKRKRSDGSEVSFEEEDGVGEGSNNVRKQLWFSPVEANNNESDELEPTQRQEDGNLINNTDDQIMPFDNILLDDDTRSLNNEEEGARVEYTENLLPIAHLDDLKQVEDTINAIRMYGFEAEKLQWTEDEFFAFQNPSTEGFNLDDPDITMSFRLYLALSSTCSEATYRNTYKIWKI
ncbi:hypothetical protein E1B28_010443 [Marasmius oreades]|uniref:Uncharacterized protein n=1 Tax=Marasmius oreades TaxID=181124 RepID=A0A9P7RX66_9AGAR|nr:uncharacterized protein E1B28_010443 [Marasmius oreades]KAG7091406.1 hypothetical protein E1B28_010443 [Marasmius oreades]